MKKLKMSDVPDLEAAEVAVTIIESTLQASVYQVQSREQDAAPFRTSVVGNSDAMRKELKKANDAFVEELRAALLKYRQSIIDYVQNVIGVEYDYDDFKESWEHFIREENA